MFEPLFPRGTEIPGPMIREKKGGGGGGGGGGVCVCVCHHRPW